MDKLDYFLVDVFTKTRFGGNQLAVFPEADNLSADLMQKIAKELNLSEATFIQKSKDNKTDCVVRIFTPTIELPMAGHPTIGTAFVLLSNNLIKPKEKDYLTFEEGVGNIKVNFKHRTEWDYKIEMEQPLPKFGAGYLDKTKIAELLSLKTFSIVENLPVQVVSCGLPVIIVPIKSLEDIKQAKVRTDLLDKYIVTFESKVLLLFSLETVNRESSVHSRFFAPSLGITEDPATGGASGPLGCYLVKYGLSNGKSIISEQGIEMGRPSTIYIDIIKTADMVTSVKVGGYCVAVGRGIIRID